MDGSFGYRAQLDSGRELSGTLNAPDQAAAMSALNALQLKVLELWPAGAPTRTRPLGAEDFKSFNQQLALLIKSGLPLETGLQLLSADAPRGRRSSVLSAISADLQAGLTLPQAVAKHRGEFPPDYALLLDAGIRTSNLSEVLVNLGNHLDLRQKLRESISRAVAYPICVIAAMLAVLMFLGLKVFPYYQNFIQRWMTPSREHIFYGMYKFHMPLITRVILYCGARTPIFAALIGTLVVLMLGFWLIFRRRPVMLHVQDWVALHIPVLGPTLRAGFVARWCDALRIGVVSGLDLPQAVELANSVTGSPALTADGVQMNQAMSRGLPLNQITPGQMLPASVAATIQSGIAGNNLPETLTVLSEAYTREAQTRMSIAPAVVTPVSLLLIGVVVFLVIYSMEQPFAYLLRSLAGPG